MYPSKSNSDAAGASDKNSETSKLTAPRTEFNSNAGSPSAPLLPSSPYNPNVPNMDPPPYSSVIAQDSSDWKNRSSSFSGGDNFRPYPPPTTGPINASKSTSGLDNTAPYPPGPGPTSQAPYPPPAQFHSTQAPYPTGPGSNDEIGKAPYPPGPSLGPVITSQPPYPTGSGYIPGPASQAPYPTGSMPMPGPIDSQRQIGFTAPVTEEPKSYPTGAYAGYGQGRPSEFAMNGNQAGQAGVIYPTESGGHEYVPNQYVPNQYGQQQPVPTNTVYVVQKTPEQNNSIDDGCVWFMCCLACCNCLCECLKLCAECSDS